jgi:hypothetical protein
MIQVTESSARVTQLYHLAAAGFVAWCAWAGTQRPELYRDAMQEDRFIEWLTVFAFGAAAALTLTRAVRRAFDVLVGLFFLFVAGEEMSWGQRVLGLTPPSYFLEHNVQQEMNLHNLGAGPKEPLTLVLVGYAIVLPLVARAEIGRRTLERIGATPPPLSAVPWFIVAIVLLTWYPLRFTGEWTELLAGSAFLVSARPRHITLGLLAPAALVFGLAMTAWSARGTPGSSSEDLRLCAIEELGAIAAVLDQRSLGMSTTHKRVWSLLEDGRVDAVRLESSFASLGCAVGDSARRRYAVDPWGTAYWIRARRVADEFSVTVYSFGPNRRRDTDAGEAAGGDDLLLFLNLRKADEQ